MNVYVDSSVLLRIILGEPSPLAAWSTITAPISCELIRIECLRTIDRARLRLGLDDEQVALHRAEVIEALESFTLVMLDGPVLARASEPFPTLIGSLDAIHLASAMLLRPTTTDLAVATHDEQLATAARAMGFEVLGSS